MAIYHFSGTVISRVQGRAAISAAAYRAGEKLYDEKQERTFDYSRKQDVVHAQIMLPEGAPEWMQNREKLWNAVEKTEKRKDSQLAREVQFTLPRELSKEQNIKLAQEFVQTQFVERGMVADLCIHYGKAKDGSEQPHAHVMLAMREVTAEGFGLKERSWNAKENYMLWREEWAEHANKYLALNGIDQTIDHRSYAEQEIDLIPQNKIGPTNLRDHERKVEEHQQIARENGEKILQDPSVALKAITQQQATFTHHDLARFVNRHTLDAEQFQVVYDKLKTSDQITALGTDEKGQERFTTREMLTIEKQMLGNITTLQNDGHEVPNRETAAPISNLTTNESNNGLSQEQQAALEHLTNLGDIKCLVGYAGTGKSKLLEEAREVWEVSGYRVQGATLSGIAAENLEGASGITSRTLASRSYYWDRGQHLTNKDILVIDEAGMLGTRQMAKIINEVTTCGAKLVLTGDAQQLQAIEAGAAFRAISAITGYVELTQVRRQQEAWQREATKELATGDVSAAINQYDKHDHVHEFITQATAKTAMVEMWNDVRIAAPDTSQIMLTYTGKDAQELNTIAREFRKENNELGEDHILATANGTKPFASGDRIYFLRNERDLGVMNGSLGTIKHIAEQDVTVLLDKDDGNGNKRSINFNTNNYDHITHGYAATIHKAQGVTVDRSYLLASKYLDSHATYVGMTRHRESADLFYSKEEFINSKDLWYALSRDRSKDIALDYIHGQVGKYALDGGLIPPNQEHSNEPGYNLNLDQEHQCAEPKELFLEKQDSETQTVNEAVQVDSELTKPEKLTRSQLQTQVTPKIDKPNEILKEINAVDELAAFQKQFEHDHPELAARALEGIWSTSVDQHSRESNFSSQATLTDNNKFTQTAANELKAFQRQYEHDHPGEAARVLAEIKSPLDRCAEKMIEEYHKFEDRYKMLIENDGSRFSRSEARDQMGRCAHEICHNDRAMNHLQKNDRELYDTMNTMIKQERVIERQRDFELSL